MSDAFDGILARRLNAETEFGKRLDPIADKLLAGFALLGLCFSQGWPWALVFPAMVIILRDVGITLLREFLGNPPGLSVSILAKWKTAAEMLGIGALLVLLALPVSADWIAAGFGVCVALIWMAALLSAWTGLQYIEKYRENS